MKIHRAQNAARNIVFGFLQKIFQFLLPFVMRTAMIYWMGVEYLGLGSLFTSVLNVLSLAELGVGSAMVYSMYLPIAENDTKTICALLRLYRIYYWVIGSVIAGVGLILLPFIPYLTNGDVLPGMNLYLLYLFSLATTVISYLGYAYKNSLLAAFQRVDIQSKIAMAISTLTYAVQLMVLFFMRDYYAYLLTALAAAILNNLVTGWIVTRRYPQYHPKGKLPEEKVEQLHRQIRDLFTAKIGGVVLNSSDSLVISAFLGLSLLAVYQNYFYIVSALMGIMSIFFRACCGGIGNSLAVESQEKNYWDFKTFTLILSWIGGMITCCILCLLQPFIKLWVGEELMLSFGAVVCFSVFFFIQEIQLLLNIYKDAAGIWHTDRMRPLITAFCNLGMNLIMIQFWGIYGVLLSTVPSTLVVGMPWLLHNLFSEIFERRYLGDYLKKLVWYLVVIGVTAVLCMVVCSWIELEGIVELIVKGVVCCLICNGCFLLSYRKMEEFRKAAALADRISKGKIPFLKKFY